MLLRNTVLAASFPRRLRGNIDAGLRSMYGRGDRFNSFTGLSSNKSSIPSGHLAPSAWVLPLKAGGMSSVNESIASLTTSGNAAQGVNIAGDVVLQIVASGTGAAVAAAIGDSILTLSVTGDAVAPLNAAGSSILTITVSGSLSAPADMAGISSTALAAALVTGGIGHMIAIPISQELTADVIASAVWAAIASANDNTGSMGEKLNDAGSASNPWTEIIESGYTAEEILRLMASVLLGTVSGAGSGIETFVGIDGLTNRVQVTTTTEGNRLSVVLDGA